MINKKMITAVSVGTVIGTSSVAASDVIDNQKSIVNIEQNQHGFLDVTNDAILTKNLYYDDLLLVADESIEAINDAIKNNFEVIKNQLLKNSCNINIELIENSSHYINNILNVNLIATPNTNHAWLNGKTNEVYFSIEIFNVEVDETLNHVTNDAKTPFEDQFNLELDLNELSDEALNDKLNSLNINLQDYQIYFENKNQYENVKIEYILDTASLCDKSFKILITPLKGHYWQNNTQVSYIGNIKIKQINLNQNLENIAIANNVCEFTKPFELAKFDVTELEFIIANLNWNTKEVLQYFTNSQIENVNINYVFNTISFNENAIYIVLEFKPILGYVWINSHICDSKKIHVKLTNVNIANDTKISLKTKDNKKNKILKINIPKSIKTDYWWNHQYENSENVLSEIFSDKNLWNVFKHIEEELKGIEILYWIKNSPKLLSWSEASIDVGVKPKQGYVWDDNGTYERKLNIIVDGFCIKA